MMKRKRNIKKKTIKVIKLQGIKLQGIKLQGIKLQGTKQIGYSRKTMRQKKSFRKSYRKNRKSYRKNRKSYRKSFKGGYGPGSNPLQGAPWNATDGGNYYSNSSLGVSVGGPSPYYAQNASPSPQHGGDYNMPNFINRPYNSVLTSLGNFGNQFNGNHQNLTSDPTNQTLQ